jgi:DNA repair protein RadC
MIYQLSEAFEFKEEPYDPKIAGDLVFSKTHQNRKPVFEERVLHPLSISSLKALPSQDRPRERLAHRGPDALSNVELLAILLGSGTKQCSVMQLASQLMARFGSLQDLSQASVQELSSLKGIGFAKAVQLKAAFSLFSRLSITPTDKICFDDPEKIFQLIGQELQRETVEVLMVILFDVKRRLIHREIAARGILTEILVHPREIYHLAIRHRAHTIVVAHNHPSGDVLPSQQDVEMTRILQKAGQIIGIPLTDHLIIAGETYLSFAAQNML